MFKEYSNVNDRTLNNQLRRYVSSGQNDMAVVAMAEKLDRMSDTVEKLLGRLNAQQEEIDSLRAEVQSKPAAKKQTKKATQPKTEPESNSETVEDREQTQ